MADGSVAITQKQLDDRLKSFDQKVNEQISREVAQVISKTIAKKEIGISSPREIRWDIASVVGSIVAATVLIFMFINTKIEAVNTRIDSLEMSMNTKIDSLEKSMNTRTDSLEKNFSEFKVEMRTSNQRILDKLEQLEQNRSN